MNTGNHLNNPHDPIQHLYLPRERKLRISQQTQESYQEYPEGSIVGYSHKETE
jgi:hypothetical protein